MSLITKLYELFRFGKTEDGFELLETERGEPGFFARGREAAPESGKEEHSVSAALCENESAMRKRMRADINPDVIFRRFLLGGETDALAVYMNGMADAVQISDFILRDGMRKGCMDAAKGDLARYAAENAFVMSESSTEKDFDKVCSAVLDGLTAVFIEGAGNAVIMDTRGFEHRSVAPPDNEKVVRGPQEAFVESIRTNITLIRRIVRTDDLVVEIRPSGADNGVRVAVIYREGVANETLVEEVKRRLARIKTRTITNSGTIEQLTEKSSRSPFPQLLSTERPDRVGIMLMQGHVAVLLDGSPFANVMPATLFTLMSTSEDSGLRRPQGTVVRVVRFIGAAISAVLPAYILALALFHQGLLSTEVLTTVASSRKMVFVPIGAEMVFLLIVFQLIREAGMRVPGNIGQAIGIIGGLILGQAAVAANLASSVILIVVALTGLGNFCIPDYSTQLAVSLFRLALVVTAWCAGLLGICSGIVVITAWMASLKSYGVPFLAPFAPKAVSKRPMILRGNITMHERADDILNTKEEKQ